MPEANGRSVQFFLKIYNVMIQIIHGEEHLSAETKKPQQAFLYSFHFSKRAKGAW